MAEILGMTVRSTLSTKNARDAQQGPHKPTDRDWQNGRRCRSSSQSLPGFLCGATDRDRHPAMKSAGDQNFECCPTAFMNTPNPLS